MAADFFDAVRGTKDLLVTDTLQDVAFLMNIYVKIEWPAQSDRFDTCVF